jgi:hypothetical protein
MPEMLENRRSSAPSPHGRTHVVKQTPCLEAREKRTIVRYISSHGSFGFRVVSVTVLIGRSGAIQRLPRDGGGMDDNTGDMTLSDTQTFAPAYQPKHTCTLQR